MLLRRGPCLDPNGIEHRQAWVRSREANGFVERLVRTVPDAFSRVNMRETRRETAQTLRAGPDEWITFRDTVGTTGRLHPGCRTQGRRPIETVMPNATTIAGREGQANSQIRRNHMEIMFGRLKDWRRVATRNGRCVHVFRIAIPLVALIIRWIYWPGVPPPAHSRSPVCDGAQ